MQYKQDDYHKLELFYANKIQQINIVGEYVRKMLSGNSDALEFVDDYFRLNYSSFLQKYFPGKRRDEINRKMTNTKLQRLLGELSETQLEIVKDDRPGSIVVMAGPGSGKTRVLVHKLAYLLLEEDVKHEQLLMLTFSRAAASEFRQRLQDLIGTAAGFCNAIYLYFPIVYFLHSIGNYGRRFFQRTLQSQQIETIRMESLDLDITGSSPYQIL